MDKIKSIFAVLFITVLCTMPVSTLGAATWGTKSTTFTVYIKKINFVDTGYGSYKDYSVQIVLPCKAGSKMADSTCPSYNYFSYTLPIVSKYSTNGYNYYVYQRSIIRAEFLKFPADGWQVLVMPNNNANALLKHSMETIKNGDNNILTFKSNGKVSYTKPSDLATSSDEEKNAADLSAQGTTTSNTDGGAATDDAGTADLTITNQVATDGTIAETKCDGDTGYTKDSIRYYKNGLLAGVPCDTPITTLNQVISIIKNVLNDILLPISATLFGIMMIFGGISYISSNGNEEQAKKAKKILTSAIIGLLITVLAYVLIYFFAGAIGGSIG